MHTKTHENITYKRAKRPGDYKAARNRQDSMADKHDAHITKMIHKRSPALKRPVKITGGLNIFYWRAYTCNTVSYIKTKRKRMVWKNYKCVKTFLDVPDRQIIEYLCFKEDENRGEFT